MFGKLNAPGLLLAVPSALPNKPDIDQFTQRTCSLRFPIFAAWGLRAPLTVSPAAIKDAFSLQQSDRKHPPSRVLSHANILLVTAAYPLPLHGTLCHASQRGRVQPPRPKRSAWGHISADAQAQRLAHQPCAPARRGARQAAQQPDAQPLCALHRRQ